MAILPAYHFLEFVAETFWRWKVENVRRKPCLVVAATMLLNASSPMRLGFGASVQCVGPMISCVQRNFVPSLVSSLSQSIRWPILRLDPTPLRLLRAKKLIAKLYVVKCTIAEFLPCFFSPALFFLLNMPTDRVTQATLLRVPAPIGDV